MNIEHTESRHNKNHIHTMADEGDDGGERKLPFVIGAGLGRTGTLSLKTALDALGYKTFHMHAILSGDAGIEPWFDAARARTKNGGDAEAAAVRAAESVLDLGYNATTDFPVCLLYRELLELRPDARVILSVRTSGDAWGRSVLDTIGNVGDIIAGAPFSFFLFWRQFAAVDTWMWGEAGISLPKEGASLAAAHDAWAASVVGSVPADRLLIHRSADGYAPICRHLDIPDSECPREYPRVNDTDSFKVTKVMRVLQASFWALAIGGIILILRRLTTKRSPKKKSA